MYIKYLKALLKQQGGANEFFTSLNVPGGQMAQLRMKMPTRVKAAYRKATGILGISQLVKDVITLLIPPLTGFFGWLELIGSAAQLQSAPMGFRLVGLLICAGLLAAVHGYAVGELTRRDSSTSSLLLRVFTVIWAVVFVAIVDGITLSGTASLLPEFPVFLFLGLALALWSMTAMMRSEAAAANDSIVEDRALTVMIFTATVLAFAVIIRLGSAT